MRFPKVLPSRFANKQITVVVESSCLCALIIDC